MTGRLEHLALLDQLLLGLWESLELAEQRSSSELVHPLKEEQVVDAWRTLQMKKKQWGQVHQFRLRVMLLGAQQRLYIHNCVFTYIYIYI